MAEAVEHAIVTGAPVRRIEQDIRGVVLTTDVGRLHARRAIVAIPPALAGRIAYAPALPARRDQLTQKSPAGSVIKCNVAYEEPFWRADGLSGQAIADHVHTRQHTILVRRRCRCIRSWRSRVFP
jgi:monoamine oxidase